MGTKTRCAWVPEGKADYAQYHDTEWGKPVHEDRKHFEMLILEGAQAGLSWSTILKRREGYRKAFAGFDPAKVARFTPARVEKLLLDPGIIRNRSKVESTVRNARLFLDVQKEVRLGRKELLELVDLFHGTFQRRPQHGGGRELAVVHDTGDADLRAVRAIGLVVAAACLGENQRRARFVDKDAVGLVDNGKIQPSQDQ